MILEWMSDPAAWAGLATLIVLEVVLGIDNLVFIAILADKLPPHQRDRARILGLSLALIMRLGLLASVSWIVTLTYPILTFGEMEISWRDVILIVGGAFLLFKGTSELHERLEGGHGAKQSNGAYAVFWHVIAQIVVLDAVFSLDSVITAVGMVRELSIMMIAVVFAVGVMMIASKPLMAFVSRHPTVVILCLGFLLMIGFSLIVEGLGFHIPKGYLYAAIGFSILVEFFNQMGRSSVRKRVTRMDQRDRTARAVLRILRGDKETPEETEEVAAIMSTGAGEIFTPAESGMIERILTLGERNVRTIMVPRVDTIWLDVNDPSDVILDEIRESGRSRFPVCQGDVDTVIGIVHAKDLLEQQRTQGRIDLASIVRQPLYVTDTMPALKLLEQFRSSAVHMAIVVDEHGTFEGVVTPNDVLTAIAGDLPELAGEETPEAVQREDGSWELDGRMSIDDVERTLNLEDMDSEDDFTTLAGFMLSRLGHLPESGEAFQWNGWRFEVGNIDNRRIGSVIARPV